MKWTIKFCYKDDCLTFVANLPDIGERIEGEILEEGIFG